MSVPRVLIAEDNPDSRELVGDILTTWDPLIMAEDGRVADLIQSDPPDLVIPTSTCRRWTVRGLRRDQAQPRHRQDPGDHAHRPGRRGLPGRAGAGADDYRLPFHPRELVARIHARLRAKEVNDALLEQRQQIQRTFERFVAHEIVERLLDDPTRVQLGGAEATVTVMFADLERFTTVSEHAAPSRLLEVLNGYLTLLVRCIKSHGGTVNKYLGDGVMALYNTPLPQPDHALRAVKTALDARAALPEYHRQLEPELRLTSTSASTPARPSWATSARRS